MVRILRFVLSAAFLATFIIVAPTGTSPVDAHDQEERIIFTEACDAPASNLPIRYISPNDPTQTEVAKQKADLGVRVADTNWEIAVGTADGIVVTYPDGTLGELVPGTQGASFPAWSPDNTEIAFIRDGRIWIVGFDPYVAPTPVTAVAANLLPTSLDWSPDGSTFIWTVFIGSASTPVIESVAAADGTRTTLRQGSHARYEPLGTWIAYTTPSGYVASMDPNGANPDVTTQKGLVGGISHDGQEIAFQGRRNINGFVGDFIGYWSWITDDSTILRDATRACDTNFYVWDWAEPWFPSFSDVPYDHVFSDDVEWLAHTGITKGCNPPDNSLFCPNSQLTRGEFAALMVRALKLPAGESNVFTDDDDSVFENEIDRLASAGITRGCNPPANDRFCPDGTVTRGQIAAFLVRAFGFADNGGGNLFVDDDESEFENDIDRLATAGVTKGCNPPTNNRFCPDDPITRAQIAAMLHRELG
jgi:WD40-like Beta Propeller Repeat